MTSHVVMFRLHDPADVDEAVRRLRGMSGRIPGMTGLRVGRDHNGGPHAYHLALISEHESPEALGDYLAHPVHREVVAWLTPRIRERAVVDSNLGD